MHEVAMAHTILGIVEQELEQRDAASHVAEIHLKVGRLRAVVPDTLVFNFDILKKDHKRLDAARLFIEEIPVRWEYGAQSKVNPLVDSARMFVDVAKVRWMAMRGIYHEETSGIAPEG